MKTLIKKFVNKETIVYLIFGILTTVVNYFIFWIFNSRFKVPVLIANVIAFIVAVIFAFIPIKYLYLRVKVLPLRYFSLSLWDLQVQEYSLSYLKKVFLQLQHVFI